MVQIEMKSEMVKIAVTSLNEKTVIVCSSHVNWLVVKIAVTSLNEKTVIVCSPTLD